MFSLVESFLLPSIQVTGMVEFHMLPMCSQFRKSKSNCVFKLYKHPQDSITKAWSVNSCLPSFGIEGLLSWQQCTWCVKLPLVKRCVKLRESIWICTLHLHRTHRLEIWDFTGLEILICFYDQETTPFRGNRKVLKRKEEKKFIVPSMEMKGQNEPTKWHYYWFPVSKFDWTVKWEIECQDQVHERQVPTIFQAVFNTCST